MGATTRHVPAEPALTAQTLANLVVGLPQVLAPPPTVPDAIPSTPVGPMATTVAADRSARTTTSTQAELAARPTGGSTAADAADAVANPAAPVTMAQLDARLVAGARPLRRRRTSSRRGARRPA